MSSVDAFNEDSTLLFDLWVVANSTRALLDHALRSTGLTAEEFAVYSAIRRCVGGVTPSRTCGDHVDSPQRRSLLLSPGLNPAIDIRRIRNPNDAWSYRIELTANGRGGPCRAGRSFMPVLQDVETYLGPSTIESGKLWRWRCCHSRLWRLPGSGRRTSG